MQHVGLSPGPFHADAVAVAKDRRLELYVRLRHFASDVRSSPERHWTFQDKIDAVCFSPDGRRIAVGIFAAESIVVIDLEKGSLLELSEPLKGSRMVHVEWFFDDWIVSHADFGMHLCMWNPTNVAAPEEEPDRISKPKINVDDPKLSFIMACLRADASHSAGDLIVLAHGDSDVSVFACVSKEQRWSFVSKWKARNVFKLEWIDPNRVLVLSDPLLDGTLAVRRVDDGETLWEMSGGVENFAYNPLSEHLITWNTSSGVQIFEGKTERLHRFSKSQFNEVLANNEWIAANAQFNGDGSRLALMIDEGNNKAFVIRLSLPVAPEDSVQSATSCVLVETMDEFISLQWDPTLTNRLIIVTKREIILWKADNKSEVVHRVAAGSGIVHREAVWNSVGNMLVVSFDSLHKHHSRAPVVISLET